MQAELANGPIGIAIQAKEDFFYYLGGNYTPIMGDNLTDAGSAKLNHAVCLAGYRDSDSKWIFKNSWGTGWGDQGYGYIAYGGEGGSGGPSWPTYMNPVGEDTTPPAIWTTPRLDFTFVSGKAYASQAYSNSGKMTNEPQSGELNYILLPNERILEPSMIVAAKSEEDTIKYDDADVTYGWYGWYGVEYWGVRFTPPAECDVIAGLVARYTKTARTDTLIVRDDASGTPGNVVAAIPYNTVGNDDATQWYRQNLSTPYSESNDFWLTYYAVTDTATATTSYFISDSTNAGSGRGERSYYYTTTWNNMISYGVDFVIRAIVTYGGGYAGLGTIWVKNIGGGELITSNVSKMLGSTWIAYIEPTAFSVFGGDSVGVTVAIDTTGLAHGVPYSDTIVVVSNAGTKNVPVTIICVGVEEETQQSSASMFKVAVNPLAENRIKISYSLPFWCCVKITLRDIA